MGTLDVLTELVLEVVFFDVVLLIFFDVEAGFEEVVIFLLVLTIFTGLVELGFFVLVVFFRLELTFAVVVGFLLDEVSFLVLDGFGLLVAFFTICIFLVVLAFLAKVVFFEVLAFFVDVAFLVLVVFFVLVLFALDVFLPETSRSSRSRFLMPPLAVAELDDKSANPVDDAVLLALVAVVFENKVAFEKVVAFDAGWYVGCSLALDEDTEAIIEDVDKAAVVLEAVSDVELCTVEVEDNAVVESEIVSDINADAADEVKDDAIVEFEVVSGIDADPVAEDEVKPLLELRAVCDAEAELDAVLEIPLARTLPSTELLELEMEFMLEELKTGRPDNEDELDRILLE